MSASSRRRARRIRDARRAAAQARVDRRRQEIADGTRKGPRVYSRKDRQILSHPGGGSKQRHKHAAKQHAKWQARNERRRAALLAALAELTQDAPARMLTLTDLGGACPFTAEGTAVLPDGQQLAWDFRFRYDRAFLEVGHADEWGLVEVCILAASWDDVQGEPYAGWLTDDEAVAVLARLFSQLAPPAPGSRFGERLANTVALATGDGGDADAPTLIRFVPQD